MGKIQFQGLLPLMIFCALIIAGLCFGQYVKSDIAPCHAEPFLTQCHPELVSGSHIRQYVKPLSEWDRLTMSNLQVRIPQFFNTMLMMQVEGESLQPKTSFWKQAGIYGLEFVGAEIGTGLAILGAMLTNIGAKDPGEVNMSREVAGYILFNILFTSTGTWRAGHLLGQKFSWKKAAIGAGIGSVIATTVTYMLTDGFTDGGKSEKYASICIGLYIFSPSISAVAFYNLK
jgi:hypothetical protein